MTYPIPDPKFLQEKCYADKNTPNSNYGKEHKYVEGIYDNQLRYSCSYCGRWFK